MIAYLESGEKAGSISHRFHHALVVDDEALTAMVIADHVRSLGLEVSEAYGPAEALSLIDRHAEIDALVTDVRMPVMTGPEMVRRALARRPGLAVVFVTGFAVEDAATAFGRWPVLRKPFDLTALTPALLRAASLR